LENLFKKEDEHELTSNVVERPDSIISVTSRPDSIISVTERPDSIISVTERPDSIISVTERPDSIISVTERPDSIISVTERPDSIISVTEKSPLQISVPMPSKVPRSLSQSPISVPKQNNTDKDIKVEISFGITKTENIEPSIVPKIEYSQDDNIDVKNIKKEVEFDTNNCFNGLNLLTEGIERLERMEPKCEQRSVRHLSLDSSFHNGHSRLGLLCDIANKRIQEMEDTDSKQSVSNQQNISEIKKFRSSYFFQRKFVKCK
jgi:hypothetical protein